MNITQLTSVVAKSKAFFAFALALVSVVQIVDGKDPNPPPAKGPNPPPPAKDQPAKNPNGVITNKQSCTDVKCVVTPDYHVTGPDHQYRKRWWYDQQEHMWRQTEGADCYIKPDGYIHIGCDAAYLWIEYDDGKIFKVDSFNPEHCCLPDYYYDKIKKVSSRPWGNKKQG
uniref:Secreted protein n=1 Tax=Moniliophthora roreri TaxID=221103 RepID=A0A0W0G172_MONRR